MNRPPTLREFAENKLGGPIAFYTYVNQARDNGASWRAIARALDRDHDLSITDVTLASWFTTPPKDNNQ